jgi:4-hydroxy-tetrahydrodipicolinate reductase
MKIAIIGYGKMGKEIKKIAIERNHEVNLIIDLENQNDFTVENLKLSDIAVEFSTPESAYQNIKKCFAADIPVVSGTTGWMNELPSVKEECKKENKAFFYASNFSLGVNIFLKINQYLARFMNKFLEYNIDIEEIHHIHKKDKPSGTAIKIADDILNEIDRKSTTHLRTNPRTPWRWESSSTSSSSA